MVNYCRVVGCHNRSDREKNLKFYRLPKVITNQGEECQNLSEERRRLWLAKLNQNFAGKNLENIRVCSAHFISGKRTDLYNKDDPDWVPSVNMLGLGNGRALQQPCETGCNSEPPEAKRYRWKRKRTQMMLEQSAVESLLLLNEMYCTPGLETEPTNSKGTQTELTGDTINTMQSRLQYQHRKSQASS